MEMRTNQASLETIMNIADANFEKETGSKYSAWMGKRTPWREPIDEEISTENVFKLIIDCIDYIWDGDEIFKAKDSSKKELIDFLDSLNSGQFQQVREFFESMPRLSHEIDWDCPKCEKSKTLVLTGLDSFFG